MALFNTLSNNNLISWRNLKKFRKSECKNNKSLRFGRNSIINSQVIPILSQPWILCQNKNYRTINDRYYSWYAKQVNSNVRVVTHMTDISRNIFFSNYQYLRIIKKINSKSKIASLTALKKKKRCDIYFNYSKLL